MTAEIVNLRLARKARDCQQKDRKAASNRAAFGRTKQQRLEDEQHRKRQARTLEGKQLDRSPSDDGAP